ncbi:hypothetical protein AC45_0068 [Escherichia coli 2-210-07_S3_C3]|nr:hypothetical protein AC45_0068 [Escherichia coli 2-210-07_S3_C3]
MAIVIVEREGISLLFKSYPKRMCKICAKLIIHIIVLPFFSC